MSSAALPTALLAELKAHSALLEKLVRFQAHETRGQLPDEMRDRHFLRYGSNSAIAAAATAVLITYTPPPGMSAVVTGLANTADLFDDGTGSLGIVHDLLRGDSPLHDLTSLNSPWGGIGCREPITIFVKSGQNLIIRARNRSATVVHSAEAQISGWVYTANIGMPQVTQGLGRP